MHVLIITQYFPPEIGAVCTRWGEYVQILLSQGHKVTVLCEIPNYPYGKFFPGYDYCWLKKEEVNKNYTILRSAVLPNNRSSSIKKIIHYISFFISAVINSFKVKNFDLLIISSPPIFTGLIGFTQKKIRKKDYWLDVRDLWPESIASLVSSERGLFYKIGKFIEKIIYSNAKGLITPVPGFKNYFKENHASKNKPKLVLMNGLSSDFLKKINETKSSPQEQFTVFFSGNFGLAQSLETVIETAKLLEKYSINFKMIGEGVKKYELMQLAERFNLKNIFFNEPVDREKLIILIKKASVCLVPLKNDSLFKTAMPSKMFEYMACSKPVICNYGDAGQLINDLNAGLVVTPEDAESYSKAILYYYKNKDKIGEHGNNGYNYVSQNMVKEDLLNDILKEIKTLS